jgi:hypothetical protein
MRYVMLDKNVNNIRKRNRKPNFLSTFKTEERNQTYFLQTKIQSTKRLNVFLTNYLMKKTQEEEERSKQWWAIHNITISLFSLYLWFSM